MEIACKQNDLEKDFLNSPLHCAEWYHPKKNLYIKLDGMNKYGSIKARAAYYMLKSVVEQYSNLNKTLPKVIESSSGNLAIALHEMSSFWNIEFQCLADETIPDSKKQQLKDRGVDTLYVQKDGHPDFRTARISKAIELSKMEGVLWTNQYGNVENAKAHYYTTGPEIWKQTNGTVGWCVGSVGSAGTICGIGNYLKNINKEINIIGVEPLGSTSFGGESHSYIAAGSGMAEPSQLLIKFGRCIDYYAQVSDRLAALECKKLYDLEGINVGLTTGHNLFIGSKIANITDHNVVVISSDKGTHYMDKFNVLLSKKESTFNECRMNKYTSV